MKRGVFIGSLSVALLLTIVSTFQISSVASAHNSHVEYIMPEQEGIEVVQRGRTGLVEVEITRCLTTGEPFTFDMIVSGDREGHSDLTIRKNSGTDISSWFTLSPERVILPGETTVKVSITPPVGALLNRAAVARIQEIGDPLSPGGHHGVKVKVTCVVTPVPAPTPTPTPLPSPAPPPMPTPRPEATPTVTPVIGEPWVATPIPAAPGAFPPTGGQPPEKGENSLPLATVIGGGLLFTIVGGYLAWRWPRP